MAHDTKDQVLPDRNNDSEPEGGRLDKDRGSLLQTAKAPSEIVAALLYLTGETYINADAQRLHRALRVAREITPLLSAFNFSSSGGVHPLSRSFDEALALLKLTRVLRMENTEYERYILDKEARDYVEARIFPRFTADELEGLRRAAAIVREECGRSETATTG